MWGKCKECQNLKQEIADIVRKLKDLELTKDSIVSSVANLRGIINRKLYSGKMKEEEPSWLDSNLAFVGLGKSKKSEELDLSNGEHP